MQDINQQLYENKSTPEGFIPVYGVVVTVPTGVYTNGQKEFTCDKTFDEVKEILLTSELFQDYFYRSSAIPALVSHFQKYAMQLKTLLHLRSILFKKQKQFFRGGIIELS